MRFYRPEREAQEWIVVREWSGTGVAASGHAAKAIVKVVWWAWRSSADGERVRPRRGVVKAAKTGWLMGSRAVLKRDWGGAEEFE